MRELLEKGRKQKILMILKENFKQSNLETSLLFNMY